ncbi:MAG: cytochrome c3 family protein [Alphaproteobacteria bacterium]|uniref:Cytochrome c3 family protein n=1 Tax=Candidatus Nitrobium versatile TaxID=2884831 RepID=A0A953M1Q5_9BACT|nr:cytochrome c3 family protein [Candidatus Nitrobium versatile]
MKPFRKSIPVCILLLLFACFQESLAEEGKRKRPPLSPQTQACIGCHSRYTPGIVQDWLTSRHAKTTPAEAVKKPPLQRRISVETPPAELANHAVGCYECHSRNPGNHRDNFDHMGFRINVVVSPPDCSTCHPVEEKQYRGTKKPLAGKNLMENPLYHTLVSTINGVKEIRDGKIVTRPPSATTLQESCLGCHGSSVQVKGMKKIKTAMGEITVPDLTNWPNQGVGRANPDGSLGTCTACHARHSFSIEMARSPYTCSQCHLEPDVPAWDVYKESKHGNIFFSKQQEWNFSAVPWVVGRDFTAPTCAVCHNSLIVSPSGEVIAERSHDFGARLWVRIFGLIYTHAQPKSGDTTLIRNKEGLPLPTSLLTGEPASEYLIDKGEQERRRTMMENVCKSCHNTDWVHSHFEKMNVTIKETDAMVHAATTLMEEAWKSRVEDRTNPFDESIEEMWVKQWLFYANVVRYASAMTGAPDYISFKLGWWELTNNLRNMKDMIEMKKVLLKKGQ